MAVRDRNQFAWQAYVITMAFVSVGLLLGMFFMWRTNTDLAAKLESRSDELKTAQDQVRETNDKLQFARGMMGFGEFTEADMEGWKTRFSSDAELGPVVAGYEEAMKLFANNLPESDKNLMKLPAYLLDTVRARNADIAAARAENNRLMADMTAKIKGETDARIKAEQLQQQAAKALADAREAQQKTLAEVNARNQEIVSKYDTYKQEFDRKQQQLEQQNQTVSTENQTLLTTVQELQDKVNEFDEPDFAAPQGEVVNTAKGGSLVWLNIGSADGLREGVVFSVLDEAELNISNARPKAQIVIEKVVAGRLSQAKALDYDVRRPIVTGDKVYSPAWRPGRSVGFALVGEMDINGDGKDDIEQVRQRIKLAGGRIDAEISADNRTTGKVDHNTSWLVLGTDLSIPENASQALQDLAAERSRQYDGMIKEAKRNGVQQISLDKLMGYLKTKNSDRTVPLGNRARAEDFSLRSNVRPPASTGDVSDLYKPRFPPK